MSLPKKRTHHTSSTEVSWFQTLFGFKEEADGTEGRMAKIRTQFAYNPETGQLKSVANDAVFAAGKFNMHSVRELRVEALRQLKDKCAAEPDFLAWERGMRVAYGDVADLMAKPEFYGAMFQVASQANFLEFIDPSFSTADGIENYCEDRTQGPACSIAAAPGTIVRNYFWDLETPEPERHGLVETLKEIGSEDLVVRAGFLLPKRAKVLSKINATLAGRKDALKDTVRVGVQSNVQVMATFCILALLC